MIQQVGSDTVTHYPLPMARHGLNPAGAPMWRIVFTDSVRRLVGGHWPDGAEEYRLARAYDAPASRGKWVLESWISAMEHTGCTAEEYPIRFQATGCMATIQHEPYPHDGTYVERHIFIGEPSGVDELIAKWHSERGIGFAQRRHLMQEAMDYEEKKRRENDHDRLVESQPDPNGSMMIRKRRQINLSPAKNFKLPGQGFSQVRG